MPIISSSEAYYLIEDYYKQNSLNEMLKVFLPNAADNIFTDIRTINVYDQFVDLLDDNYKEIGKELDIPAIEIDTFSKNNYYQSLYEYVRTQSSNQSKELFTIKNEYDTLQTFYSNNEFAFFISSLSYSILVIKKPLQPNQELLIKFISMILIASKYIIVLCVSKKYSSHGTEPIFYWPLFNEVHLFRNYNDFDMDKIKYENNIYFYIYVSTNSKQNPQIENPYVQIFHISAEFGKVFYVSNAYTTLEKKYSLFNNFHKNKILITLYNCQYFESYDLKECWVPIDVKKMNKGYIQTNDFIEWTGERVQFFESPLDQKPSYYIDFNEIHYLKIDHHIKNPIYLIGLGPYTIYLIEYVQNNIKYSTYIADRLKSKRSKTEKHVGEKLLYAFHKLWKHCEINGEKIIPYLTQIYAVNLAINYLNDNVNAESNNINDSKINKGCIFQVKTGEGKSIIIRALAEIFARMGKVVHIVTSNILLASRDYEDSYDYFKECGFKSSILLHDTELKNILNDKNKKFYPSYDVKDFYNENWFDKRTGMNTKILKRKLFKIKSNIIFSTFFNFEAWYLKFSEDHPVQAESYFKDCYLIIDESDTILIDEISNGTIISREMKSNGIQVLEEVFDMYMANFEKTKILEVINQKYPNCADVSLLDVTSMLNDINYALKFEDGSNYIIEYDENGIGHIVPFDGKQKGITEKEKEFNGFIHQFIGIKEKRKNPSKNIMIQPLTLNYKYISHPIYVNQYQCVWGFTGTVGTEKDKEILKKYYKLDTFEIPIHSTNYRRDLPTIICQTESERDEKIIYEITKFHQREIPILVIFDSLTHLEKFKILLESKINDKSNIMEFNGKVFDKSSIENLSGNKGKITLGTNFCGRGTNIHYNDEYPLHVIITYGPRNVRALGQAIGRTGRNGKHGTTRIICTKKDYFLCSKVPNEDYLNNILYEFESKKNMQLSYINLFRDARPWIFNLNEASQKKDRFDSMSKTFLNEAMINVNRITAANYEFPICMSIDTFHKIQFQKIYSLKNCPECIYTWQLFQRYLRELILETWSLFLNEFTKEYEITKEEKKIDDKDHSLYIKLFSEKFINLEKKFNEYFIVNRTSTMNETFMEIHQNVRRIWEDKIMEYFPKEIRNTRFDKDPSSFLCFKIGFYPFELKSKSGARICMIDEYNDEKDIIQNDPKNKNAKNKKEEKKMKEINFIEDPELIYYKKDKPFSITHIIDAIFEKICEKIDNTLSNLLGLHFFIRRGFGGCEFGVCVDPLFDKIEINEKHCLFDLNPLVICTIQCKSEKPFLAGILIIALIFISIIAAKIAAYVTQPGFTAKDLLKELGNKLWQMIKRKIADVVVSQIEKYSPLTKIFDNVIKLLTKSILDMLSNDNDCIAIVMKTILSMISPCQFSKLADKVKSKIKIKMNPLASQKIIDIPHISDLIKIGVLFILLIAAFIKQFKAIKQLKQYSKMYQEEFNSNEASIIFKEKNVDKFEVYKDLENKFDASIGNIGIFPEGFNMKKDEIVEKKE